MVKRNKIIYWVLTAWLAVGIVALLPLLLVVSWYFGPANRKTISINFNK